MTPFAIAGAEYMPSSGFTDQSVVSVFASSALTESYVTTTSTLSAKAIEVPTTSAFCLIPGSMVGPGPGWTLVRAGLAPGIGTSGICGPGAMTVGPPVPSVLVNG